MNILYLGSDGTYYGSRGHDVGVAESMTEMGHKVFLCTPNIPDFWGQPSPENLETFVHPTSNKLINITLKEQISRASRFINLVIDLKKFTIIDVIFASTPGCMDIAIELGMIFDIPVFVQLLDIPIWRIEKGNFSEQLWSHWLEYLALADGIIVNTEITAHVLVSLFEGRNKIPKNNDIYVIPYCINYRLYDAVPEQEEQDQIVYVSRLESHKNVGVLLDAMSKNSNLPKLVIIGGGTEEAKLQQIAKEKNINCEFKGVLNDRNKIAEIKKSKFLVFVSDSEYIAGLPPAEALYCGKPAICVRTNVLEKIYKDSVEWTLNDPVEIAKKIDEINHWNYRKQKGEQGREFIKKNLTSDRQAREILEVMKQVIK